MKIGFKTLVPLVTIFLFVGIVSGEVSQPIESNVKTPTAWAKGYKLASNSSIARYVVQTPDGGYLAGLDCYSGSCATIMKLGVNGFIKWQKNYVKDLTVMQYTSDNGSIFAGQNVVCKKLSHCTSIIKVDSNGDVQWENDLLYTSSSPETNPKGIQQTSDGGYIVAGSARGTTTNYSTWVAKLDSSGNLTWQRFFTNSNSNGATAVRQTTDGYIISGYSQTNNLEYIMVVKLDLFGNLVWQKTYTTNYGSFATSLQTTSDGGYIISGDVYTLSYFPSILLKLDSKGNIQWSNIYSDAGAGFQINSIVQTTDGYAISGDIYNGQEKAFIARLDKNGTIQWQKIYGVLTADRIFTSINQTNDGGFVVSGVTNQFSGNFDSWIVRIDGNGNISGCSDIQDASVIKSQASLTVGSGGLNPVINGFAFGSSIALSGSESYTLLKEC